MQIEDFKKRLDAVNEKTGVIAARGDIRLPVPRVVERVDREVVSQFRHNFFKQVQLRTQRVKQQQGRSFARSDVSDGIAAEVSKVNRDARGPWKGFGNNGRGSRGLDYKREQPQADGGGNRKHDDIRQRTHNHSLMPGAG